MEVKIEHLVQKGQGLGHTDDGKVVFVAGGLPGELLDVKLTSQKKDYCNASVVRVLEPSEDRVEPLCPLYGICGGCNLMHMSHPAQIKAKQEIFLQALVRSRALEDKSPFDGVSTCSGQALGYRTRVRFEIRDNQAGFFKMGTSDFVPVPSCMVLDPRINSLLFTPSVLREYSKDSQTGVCLSEKGPLLGNQIGHVVINGRSLPVSNQVFFQSNLSLLSDMISYVIGLVVGSKVMDLYSGIGTFSAFLEDKYQVLAVERDPKCLSLARSHLKKTSFYTESVEDFSFRQHSDTIIVDPPRVGLEKRVPSMLAKLGAQRIIYVSCDSATFARDAAVFGAEGYDLRSSRLFDFYPQTSHMESVSVLDRRA